MTWALTCHRDEYHTLADALREGMPMLPLSLTDRIRCRECGELMCQLSITPDGELLGRHGYNEEMNPAGVCAKFVNKGLRSLLEAVLTESLDNVPDKAFYALEAAREGIFIFIPKEILHEER